MTILTLSDVSLEFGDKTILKNISFSVNEGDKLGIIGVNGAGKTSLVRIITGAYAQTSGDVFISKGKNVGSLEQNVIVTDEEKKKSIIEYMYSSFQNLITLENEIKQLEIEIEKENDKEKATFLYNRLNSANEEFVRDGGLEFRNRCRSALTNMGFSAEMQENKVESLSGGQHTRLSLSRLLAKEPDILILDEPTNHLDITALTWLEDFIKNYKKTVIIISHDRYFLDKTTNKTLDIRYGKAKLYSGSYSKCKAQEEQDAASLEKKYKEQMKEIEKIRQNIAFQRSCGMEHNFVTIRAKEKQIERMDIVELAPKEEKSIRIKFDEQKESAGDVLSVESLSFAYPGKTLFSNLSFLIKHGERVFFLGENGCGKSTLMRILMGKLAQNSGRIEFGYNIKIGYFDQENANLSESNTVYQEMRSEYPTKTDLELRSALALFLFGAEEIDKKISELSGGERARITLAKLMLRKVNMLILDEPTNHLDIASREALETALSAFSGTVISVSHDRYFIDTLATRIIELSGGSAIDYPLSDTENGYAEYLRLKEAKKEQNEIKAEKVQSEQKALYLKNKDEARLKRMDESKRKRAEQKAKELEEEQKNLKEKLFGEAASDYVLAAEIDKRINEIEDELLALYEIICS